MGTNHRRLQPIQCCNCTPSCTHEFPYSLRGGTTQGLCGAAFGKLENGRFGRVASSITQQDGFAFLLGQKLGLVAKNSHCKNTVHTSFLSRFASNTQQRDETGDTSEELLEATVADIPRLRNVVDWICAHIPNLLVENHVGDSHAVLGQLPHQAQT
jgi:hypothetical protein